MKHDYEIINGKPHLGLWFGTYFQIKGDGWCGELEKNPIHIMYKQLLNNWMIAITPETTENRYIQFIPKPPSYFFNLYGTLGIKFMIWGRAFKVMKLNKNYAKCYTKRRISGRQRWVRIDK